MPLEDVIGRSGPELVERLAGTAGWAERFALVDRALRERLAARAPARPEVGWALARLGGGRVAVGALARELGWSHRRLTARFRDEVGLPPKLIARIMRLERLVERVDADPGLDWARAAAACGYADQSHLAREVRELTALTPTELRAARVDSVQDVDGRAAERPGHDPPRRGERCPR